MKYMIKRVQYIALMTILIGLFNVVDAVSLQTIQQNSSIYKPSIVNEQYGYYIDVNNSRIIENNDSRCIINGKMIYVDFLKKKINETDTVLYYNYQPTINEINKNVLKNLEQKYTLQTLKSMDKKEFKDLFEKEFELYVQGHPVILMQLGSDYVFNFDGNLVERKNVPDLDALQDAVPLSTKSESFVLALILYQELLHKAF